MAVVLVKLGHYVYDDITLPLYIKFSQKRSVGDIIDLVTDYLSFEDRQSFLVGYGEPLGDSRSPDYGALDLAHAGYKVSKTREGYQCIPLATQYHLSVMESKRVVLSPLLMSNSRKSFIRTFWLKDVETMSKDTIVNLDFGVCDV